MVVITFVSGNKDRPVFCTSLYLLKNQNSLISLVIKKKKKSSLKQNDVSIYFIVHIKY